MADIRILQLGNENWNNVYELPVGIRLDFVRCFTEPPKKPYDLFFIDRELTAKEMSLLHKESKAYTVFVTEEFYPDLSGTGCDGGKKDSLAWLCLCKKARRINYLEIQNFLRQEARYYYPKPYGEKFNLRNLTVARGFSGQVQWKGNYGVMLRGEFGSSFRQIAFWRMNLPLQRPALDFWLEYRKSPAVGIAMTVTEFASGSVSQVVGQWEFNEEELENIVQIPGDTDGWLFVSLNARGSGELQIIALHDRVSRGKHGYFLPGGERYQSSEREEAFRYFEPGDRMAPLCVYFSGYKTLQGFEGYYMMRKLGCPFLLIAEPRLEGGGFYMGSPEYEKMFVDMIRQAMEELGFSPGQVVLSGLSMGTFGALYYGCDIRPYAVIAGKPLVSIGNVAANEKHLRPGGFPTSLDVLQCQCGGMDREAVKRLNDKFWDKFDGTDWGKSRFVISYMLEDDYDTDAYPELLSHLQEAGVQVYGKGIHGRHNDNTDGIVNWFLTQYRRILREDFGRKLS